MEKKYLPNTIQLHKQLKPLIDSEKDLDKRIKKSERILDDLKEEKEKNDIRIDKLED